MSYRREDAERVVKQFITLIEDACQQVEIAGSIRRGKPDVKDAEVVVRPTHVGSFLARLDRLVVTNVIDKAQYDGRHRWGEKYRGLMYHGLRIEVFLGDEHNFGYIYWLRTGPGDANEMVMRRVYNAPFRFQSGYVWHGQRKLHVPDEREVFRLLGIPWQAPEWRSPERYLKLIDPAKFASEFVYAADRGDEVPTGEFQQGLW